MTKATAFAIVIACVDIDLIYVTRLFKLTGGISVCNIKHLPPSIMCVVTAQSILSIL